MMLVLIQLAVGIIVAERILTWVFKNTAPAFDVLNWEDAQFPMAMGTLISAILGIGISGIFRASRPEPRETLHSQKCWPIRERFVSTLFAATVAVYVLLLSQSVDLPITPWSVELCGYAAAAIGVGCIAVSGMVHVAAQREVWSALRVFRQFGWTTVMFGWTAGLVVLNLARLDSTGFRSAPVGLLSCCLLLEAGAILTTARLFGVSWFMRRNIARDRLGTELTTNIRIARLLSGPLRPLTKLRAALGYLSGVLFPLLVASQPPLSQLWITQSHVIFLLGVIAALALMRCAAEVLESYLFFVTAIDNEFAVT